MNPTQSTIRRIHLATALFAVLFLTISGTTAREIGEKLITIQPGAGSQASPFILKGTEARAWITGPVAHVEVTQIWHNPNQVPVDGLYIFPLPENAAVNDMSLKLGDRVIHSDMKRREEARRIYEQARDEGRVAGLLDQERSNIFAQQVANIMPGMKIEVVLAFDHEIKCEDSQCEYVFPTVVGPRFIPAGQGDPGKIDPPVVSEGSHTGQSLEIYVNLNAGVSIRDIQSATHRIRVDRLDDTQADVNLSEGRGSLLNRDFKLSWGVGGDRPEMGIMAWRDPMEEREPGVFTIILQPPTQVSDEEAVPRELVFVLDCSGSMAGVPLEASKNVVRKAIRTVRPQDTFQIIRFSENASGLGPHPLKPTPENIRKALAYVESLRGSGGTHMMAGIKAALDRPADPDRLRIVAFLTDGYIGNEDQVFLGVRQMLGNARIFSFGIGSSVNRHLLEGLAEEGRGASAFMGPREKPGQMVDRFIKRIDTPVLTDIRLSFDNLEVEDLEPARIPDLFAGQSLLIHGRYRNPGTGLITLEARRAGEPVTMRKVAIFLEREDDNAALGRLWARARIHRLERSMRGGQLPKIQEAITRLGLRHRLMTQWTSLVAVDSFISNTTGHAESINVPVEMPEDVSYQGIYGQSNFSSARAIGGVSALQSLAVNAISPSSMAPPPPGAMLSPRSEPLKHKAGDRQIARNVLRGMGGIVLEDQKAATGNFKEKARTNEAARSEGRSSGSDSSRLIGEGAADEDKRSGGKVLADAPEEHDGFADRLKREDLQSKEDLEKAPLFLRITLVQTDGSRILVQEDGDVWVMQGSRRTLVHVLTSDEMNLLEVLLMTMNVTGLPAAHVTGSRLEVVGTWGGTMLSLPHASPAIQDLVRFMQSLT
jgi:Ca-activated chloride channel family protein